MTIGEMIRILRKDKGLTQKELGQLCGINESQIRRYELGLNNSNPKAETLKKIADALVEFDNDMNYEILEQMFHAAAENEEQSKSIDIMLQFISKKLLEKNPDFSSAISNIRINQNDVVAYNHRILIEKYESLNAFGQIKAMEHLDMLAKIPEYQHNIGNTGE